MNRSTGTRRLRIERIEVDLRGIGPAAAEAAARALGPALALALRDSTVGIGSAERLEAGRIASAHSPEAGTLAAGIAQRIAQAIRGRAN